MLALIVSLVEFATVFLGVYKGLPAGQRFITEYVDAIRENTRIHKELLEKLNAPRE